MKILKYVLCIVVLLGVLTVTASAATKDAPDFPDDNDYWVIYFDETVGTFVLGTATLTEPYSGNVVMSWGYYLSSLDHVPLGNINFYYLSSPGDEWIPLDGHTPPDDFARKTVVSNVPVYDSEGKLYLKPSTYPQIKLSIPSLYQMYSEKAEKLLGEWIGTYGAPQGKMGVELLIYRTEELLLDEEKIKAISEMANGTILGNEVDLFPVEDIRYILEKYKGEYIALFNFFPSADTPNAEYGLYVMSLGFDIKEHYISLLGTEWIARNTYEFAHLARVMENGGRISANVHADHYADGDILGRLDVVKKGGGASTEKCVAVLTTDKDMTMGVGDEMKLGFAVCDIDGEIEETVKLALTVSNPEIISVSDFEKSDVGYVVTLKGLTTGASYLTASDPKTGASQTVLITVVDVYSKNYSYSIYDIEPFYPAIKADRKVLTNIYNLNGLYVNNYSCTENDDGTLHVEFNVYNTQYHCGAVEIYTADGELYSTDVINKFSNISSLKDTLDTTFYLLVGTVRWEITAYYLPHLSECIEISVDVPAGGKIVITNNSAESEMVSIYNAIDLLATVLSQMLAALGEDPVKFATPDFVEFIMDDLKDTKELRDIFADAAKSLIVDFAKNTDMKTPKARLQFLFEGFDGLFSAYKIDWRKFFLESAVFAEETAAKLLLGPFGKLLDTCFATNKFFDMATQLDDIDASINAAYATLYSNLEEATVNKHGVVVYTNGNLDVDSTLQVFKVYKDDPEAFSGKSCEFFNISFVKDNKYVQPNGLVEVRIPIPYGMKVGSTDVYRQEEDGTWTKLNARQEEGYLVFETEHFSNYAIVGEEEGLVIDSLPEKLTYKIGEKLDYTGLELSLGGTRIEDGYMCAPNTFDKVGDATVQIRYGTLTAEFTVTVEDGGASAPEEPNEPDVPDVPDEPGNEDPIEPDEPIEPGVPNEPEAPSEPTEEANNNGNVATITITIAAAIAILLIAAIVIFKKRK